MNDEYEKLKERILELEAWKVSVEATLFNIALLLKQMHRKLYEDHPDKVTDPEFPSFPPRRMPGDRID